MLGLLIARLLQIMRRYLAALLFETARLALFASIRAFRRRLLNRRLLHEAMHVSLALYRGAFLLAFGTNPRRRRKG